MKEGEGGGWLGEQEEGGCCHFSDLEFNLNNNLSHIILMVNLDQVYTVVSVCLR